MILKVYQRSLHFKAMKKIIARVCLFVFFFYEGMSLRNIPLPQKKKTKKTETKTSKLRQTLQYTKFWLSVIHKYFKLINKKGNYSV